MTLFFPDLLLPDDPNGLAYWLTGHYYEHQAMGATSLSVASPIRIPSYDLLAFAPDKSRTEQDWFSVHELVHEALRAITGVQGYDLSISNWQDHEAFFDWTQNHAIEHQQLRQVFGLS